MANKTPTRTTLKKGDNLPPRGRSNKTLILEMLRENSHLELGEGSTKEQAEKAFFNHVAIRAFNAEDTNSGMCLKLLSDKGWASIKPTSDTINFSFTKDATPADQASEVLHALSIGEIAPDTAKDIVTMISSMLKIQEVTDLEDRIIEIERRAKEIE